jgi:quinol monooxygenase YgiN
MREQITLIVPVKAKPETQEIVRNRLIEMAESTREESGNINYIVHELTDDPGSFVIYENWRDQAALDFHMEQVYLKKFLADGEKLLREEIRGTFCRVVG